MPVIRAVDKVFQVVIGPPGGRLSQRIGPFKVATVGLLLGAAFMFTYGQLPSGVSATVALLTSPKAAARIITVRTDEACRA